MREYTFKEFYKKYKYKKIFKDEVEYSVHVAGVNRGSIKQILKEQPELIKKSIKICEKELKKWGRSDAAGANQGYVEELFVCVHWEAKQIIIMHEMDK